MNQKGVNSVMVVDIKVELLLGRLLLLMRGYSKLSKRVVMSIESKSISNKKMILSLCNHNSMI